MKINKAKLLVGTLAVVATAATVGSISGTVAWFQYSTRSTVSYTGASAHCTENLEIRIRSDNTTRDVWKSDLTNADIAAYLTAAAGASTYGAGRTDATSLRPVTSGDFTESTAKVPALTSLKKNPIYQYWANTYWGVADLNDYVLIPLELRVKDVNGGDAAYLAKKIYVSNIHLAAAADNGSHTDVSDALRVGISAAQTGATSLTPYATFCNEATADDRTVAVHGYLDLNNDGAIDTDGNYDWDTHTVTEYGEASKSATARSIKTVSSGVGIADDTDPYTIKGTEIGSTAADKTLSVDVLLYLEGWQTIKRAISAEDVSASYADQAALVSGVDTLKPVIGKYYKTGGNKYYRYDGKIGTTPTATFTEVTVDSSGNVATALWDATKDTGAIGAKFNFGIRFSAEAHAAH